MQKIIYALAIATLLAACSSKDGIIENIRELEIKLYSESETIFDRDVADNLVSTYKEFVDAYPDDEKAPAFLFKAGEVSMGMENPDDALACYKQVYTDYPNYSKASTALFLEGFVYETQASNLAMAQKCYTQFLDKYSDHTLADDAEFSLKNLGKSDEEIIREFEKNLQKKAEEGNEESAATEAR